MVRLRNDMVRLRLECIKFGSEPPKRSAFNEAGAPKYEIPKNVIEEPLADGFSIKDIALLLSVSERTVYRRMAEYDLRKHAYSSVGEEQLDMIVKNLTEEFPRCGENMIGQIIRRKGYAVQRFLEYLNLGVC